MARPSTRHTGWRRSVRHVTFHHHEENAAMQQQPNTHGSPEPVETAQGDTPQTAPQLPSGGRLLTTDEAVEVLVTGDHPEGARGTVEFDAALIEALREGWLVACRMPDGQVAFTRVADGTTRLTPPA
jgi:hypothetical protein